MYNALLGQDWIHANRGIPLSLNQYLIMWHKDGSVKVVKVNAKPFIVTSNASDALLYTEDMGPIDLYLTKLSLIID